MLPRCFRRVALGNHLCLDGPKRFERNRLESIAGSKNDPNQRGDSRENKSSANERVPPFQGSSSRYYCGYRKADEQPLGKRSAPNGCEVILRVLIGVLK